MANRDVPNGFVPVGDINGGAYNGSVLKIGGGDRSGDATNNHGDIYIGDPITIASNLATVADSNDPVHGVCVGVGNGATTFGKVGAFNPDNLTQRYAPLTDTSTTIYYVPVKNTLFKIQTALDLDLKVGSLADTNIAANVAHGSQTTGHSTAELTTASNNDCRVMKIGDRDEIGNDETLANAEHIIQFEDIMYQQT